MYFEKPVPFHVAYPLSSFYEDEKTASQDLEMMRSRFPKTSANIQKAVEEACDRMEYDGSMMYDEYPDGSMIAQMARKIGNQIKDQAEEERMEEELFEMQTRYRAHSVPVDELIQVLLTYEIFRRRCRRRRARRYL